MNSSRARAVVPDLEARPSDHRDVRQSYTHSTSGIATTLRPDSLAPSPLPLPDTDVVAHVGALLKLGSAWLFEHSATFHLNFIPCRDRILYLFPISNRFNGASLALRDDLSIFM